MQPIFLLFLVFSQVFADSFILDLSSGARTVQVEPGSNIYLASSDNIHLLQKITITNGLFSISGDALASHILSDGVTQSPWSLTTDILKITTTNSDDATAKLTGFFFVTTAAQAKDPNFNVYIPDVHKTIDRQQFNDSTMVFLNVADNSVVITGNYYNSIITEIQQLPKTTLKFYAGRPVADYLDPQNHDLNPNFFSNPIESLIKADTKFYDNVEKLQIPEKIWFARTNGPIILDAFSGWEDSSPYTTTDYTTTGLLTNQPMYIKQEVNFMVNLANNRTVGNNISIRNLKGSLNITFLSQSADFIERFDGRTSLYNALIQSDARSTKLIMDKSVLDMGPFYIQYFVQDGILMPTTTTVTTTTPTTTTSRATTTTTGEAGARKYILAIIFVVLAIF